MVLEGAVSEVASHPRAIESDATQSVDRDGVIDKRTHPPHLERFCVTRTCWWLKLSYRKHYLGIPYQGLPTYVRNICRGI